MKSGSTDILRLIPEWLTAIGTLLAVIVALYLARRDRLIRCLGSARISHIFVVGEDNTSIHVAIAVTNIGMRSFVFTGVSWRLGIFKKRNYEFLPPRNEYSNELPIKLQDGEQAKLFIPLEAFRANTIPSITAGQPRFLRPLWLWFMKVIVYTTTGETFGFRVGKDIRREILGKNAKA